MDIPVYLFAGFLDGGKTTFINGILEDGFAIDDPTLLICCEEGAEEYDPKVMRNVSVVTVESEDSLNPTFLKKCERKYRPRQVLIEFNGMWSIQRLYQSALPNNWVLYQIMTMVEASTFDVYAKNLGQLMMEKITNADMIIFNRCNEALHASLRQRNLRMVNRRASIYLEDVDGTSEDYASDDMCPFDLSQDVIDIPDDDFGVWYVDVMDHPDRYKGKKIHAKTVVAHLPQYPGDVILGRFAMTCCANDISFLGLVARGNSFDAYPNRAWAEVTARVDVAPHKAYDGPGPIMEVLSVAPCAKPKEEVIGF